MIKREARRPALLAGHPGDTTVTATGGMVATSHPAAAQAGVAMLDEGGTAADAAVAAAAVLCVVDPRSTGIGGDAFALHWSAGESAPTALEAAGPAPAGLSVAALRAAGFERMPEIGPWTVTVPGAVSGWEALLVRHGWLGLERVLEPAIALADGGYEVAPMIAAEWAQAAPRIAGDAAARALLLRDGRPPAAGERMANPELAGVLREIAAGGAAAFYRGRAAAAIGAAVEHAGGPLRASDLADWAGAGWAEPLWGRYRDIDVIQLPPPGQGLIVLEALGVLDGLELASRADEEHACVEAIKLAFADAERHIADPLFEGVPVDELLSPAYLAARRAAVDMTTAGLAAAGVASDTVYVAAVDGDGTACSFIQSLYEGFGSGVAVPGTGIVLQNRGAGFVLDDEHPNRPAPGKRPYHTIIPSMLARDGEFLGCLGVVGGFMQPQGHVQILRHLLDHGLGLQAALDAPRLRFVGGRRVLAERGYDPAVVAELGRRGHEIGVLERFPAGGAQAVLRENSLLYGASDPRKDGCALGR
jgi:gamma-glutamyltranspeptidase / glutathione hydrolase